MFPFYQTKTGTLNFEEVGIYYFSIISYTIYQEKNIGSFLLIAPPSVDSCMYFENYETLIQHVSRLEKRAIATNEISSLYFYKKIKKKEVLNREW